MNASNDLARAMKALDGKKELSDVLENDDLQQLTINTKSQQPGEALLVVEPSGEIDVRMTIPLREPKKSNTVDAQAEAHEPSVSLRRAAALTRLHAVQGNTVPENSLLSQTYLTRLEPTIHQHLLQLMDSYKTCNSVQFSIKSTIF